MSGNIDELKDKIITAARVLLHEGLIQAQYSLSCRLDENHMLINDNVGPALLTRDLILVTSFEEEVKVGNVHPAIYKTRGDVNAVVHAHPLHAIVLSTVDDEFIPIHNYGVLFHGQIKVHAGHGQVKTREKAQEIADLLRDGRAILQRGHGTVVVGRNLEEAVLATIYLEEAAKVHFMAKTMGTPHYISREQSEKITGQVFKERSNKKAWDHYVSKLALP